MTFVPTMRTGDPRPTRRLQTAEPGDSSKPVCSRPLQSQKFAGVTDISARSGVVRQDRNQFVSICTRQGTQFNGIDYGPEASSKPDAEGENDSNEDWPLPAGDRGPVVRSTNRTAYPSALHV